MKNELRNLSTQPNLMSSTTSRYFRNEIDFESSSKKKRFANYCIDYIVFLFFSFTIGIFIGLVLLPFGIDFEYMYEEGSLAGMIFEWALGAVLFLLYYTTLEYYLEGKTIAKFITKTRAVTVNCEPLSFSDTLKRSLTRLIPFEPFSFLADNNGWHDKFSHTTVIDDETWEDKDWKNDLNEFLDRE